MRFVQLLLTDDQAELTAAALRDAEKTLRDLAGVETGQKVSDVVSEDLKTLGRLSMLFQDASENPAKYTPTGKTAATVKSVVKRAKGPAQPQSLRKKRAGRHQRRRAKRHFFRRSRQLIDGFNAAQAAYEREAKEHATAVAEIAERVEGQPKYTVTDGFGNVIMAGVPAEFILYEDGESLYKPAPKIEIAR